MEGFRGRLSLLALIRGASRLLERRTMLPWKLSPWTSDRSLGLALGVDLDMLRRKPTRLELKLDDIEEFESIRKDLENRKKQKEEVDVVGISDGEGAIGLSSDPKSREQMINDRIGYKPQPKPNNRSSQFGSFEF